MDDSNLMAEFEQWIEELSRERQVLALQRACKALDLECHWEGDRIIVDDEFDHDELNDALTKELWTMCATETVNGLVEDGFVVANGVDEDGEIMYAITPEGEAEYTDANDGF